MRFRIYLFFGTFLSTSKIHCVYLHKLWSCVGYVTYSCIIVKVAIFQIIAFFSYIVEKKNEGGNK